jgi:hypothetical protein
MEHNATPAHAYPLRAWCAANGIPTTAAYTEIKEGRLKTLKIGRRRYISDKASREYFAEKERKAQGKAR